MLTLQQKMAAGKYLAEQQRAVFKELFSDASKGMIEKYDGDEDIEILIDVAAGLGAAAYGLVITDEAPAETNALLEKIYNEKVAK